MTISKYVQINNLGSNITEDELIRIFFSIEDPLLLELKVFNKNVEDISNLLSLPYKFDTFTFENKVYTHIKYEDINLGQWIEVTESIKDLKNVNYLINLLWKDQEGFGIDQDLVDDLHFNVLIVSLSNFTTYKEKILSQFKDLFNYNPEDEEEEEEEKFTHPTNQLKIDKDKNNNSKQEKWGLWLLAFSLSKYDITKLEEVLKLNLEYVLSISLMVKDLKIEINPVSNIPPPF